MIGLAILIAAMFMIPLTLRLTSKATRRRAGQRALRWRGIQWDKPADPATAGPSPSPEIDDVVARALAKQRAGDVAGALADYDQALLQKRTALVLNNRGCALLESGEVARAITDLREAVSLEPDNATAHCSLAEAYARSGEDIAALESLRTAARLDPRWREHARTAREFERLRDSPDGRKWLAEPG
jgi:tetratricopeptide (TPR) repeat protein